jgi:ATP-dependent RNA helicase DeaD
MKAFRDLGIIEPILEIIKEEGFEKPTEIQSKTIPLIMQGKDVIGGSATGSGKTLAFGAGIIANTHPGQGVQALVLTPTRELAEQVKDELKRFSRNKKLKVLAIYGGVAINPQIDKLSRADVVVGTPGRVLDHIGRRTIELSKVKILVLDEADRMLDMGFIEDVERIISKCPKERQTLLFSATIWSEVAHICKAYMNEPEKVLAESYVDPRKLTQLYYDVPNHLKFSLLMYLLKREKSGLVMVFCNSRHMVDFVDKNLKLHGLKSMAIHGGFSQDKRNKTIESFHEESVQILVCTDVAARGLDIEGVTHIYNYDIPQDSKEYVHRIGRTARAGAEGKVINILAPMDHDNFSRVERDNEFKIPKEHRPHIPELETKAAETTSDCRRGPPRRGPPRRGFLTRRSHQSPRR